MSLLDFSPRIPLGTFSILLNDTSRYLDDIFTIDNPEFENHIPDIYPTKLQLNKANTSDKETSFLDLNITVIGSDVHTSVCDKRDDFGFPIVNFPWLSCNVLRLPSYGVYISQLLRFARCCTSVSDFNSKNPQITSKLLTQGYIYHKFRKTFGKFFRSYSDPLSKRYVICNPGNVPNKGRNFNTQIFRKMILFIISMISRHWFQTKLLLYIA